MQRPLERSISAPHAVCTLRPHDHPCLIYETPDEQADAFVPYLHAGLLAGELCVYVVDDTHPEFICAAFRSRNVDIDPFMESGAFRIITKHDAYLTDGYFDITKMMGFWQDTVDKALRDGYTALRAAAEMTWALGSEPGTDLLVPYESQLNDAFPQLKVSALCQYNRKRFPAKVIKDMINVHPIVVSGSRTLQNPAFMSHAQFIESHDDMEVQKLLDTIELANMLQTRNKELERALEAKLKASAEVVEAKRLQAQLEKALEDERRTRQYAQQVKAELEDFVNNATEGLHWVGPEGTVLWANRAELELLGYTAEEYIGRNVRDFHADPATIEDIFERLQRKEVLRNYPALLRAKDGSIKSVLISSNVLWRDGKFVHTQCFTRDITDLELAQKQASQSEEIRELNEELHSLSRIISHELQEPIAKIRSYLSLLAVRYKGSLGADADEFIDICTGSAKLVHRMIDDLWLYARLTRIEDSQVSSVSARSVVAGVIEEYSELIHATGAKVVCGNLPTVNFSQRHLAYIFESLLNNALSYRRPGVAPVVEIDSRLDNGEWIFSVSDNGSGIDPMHFRDIFRAFYRIDARPGEGGTGMGLAICQKIAHARGGRVWVDSRLGLGSTFFLSIPA